ncbi:MAG: hypothetical protein KDD40_09405 [Bdellovibrionales bacterium]|nr:hypothetical protein [Bdellovibrionales bacterium]
MNKLENEGRLITCILPKGDALALLKKLFDHGVTRANFAFARGFDINDLDNPRTGIPDAEEKEIVTIVAKNAQEGEELFDFVFIDGNINRPNGGLIYMSKLRMASVYELPAIDESMMAAKAEKIAEL